MTKYNRSPFSSLTFVSNFNQQKNATVALFSLNISKKGFEIKIKKKKMRLKGLRVNLFTRDLILFPSENWPIETKTEKKRGRNGT